MEYAPAQTREEIAVTLDKLASAVHRRRLAAPAIFLLETYKPLTSLMHAATVVCMPVMSLLFGARLAHLVPAILESRENVEGIIQRIEKLSSARSAGHG